jgi:hypothetical protein
VQCRDRSPIAVGLVGAKHPLGVCATTALARARGVPAIIKGAVLILYPGIAVRLRFGERQTLIRTQRGEAVSGRQPRARLKPRQNPRHQTTKSCPRATRRDCPPGQGTPPTNLRQNIPDGLEYRLPQHIDRAIFKVSASHEASLRSAPHYLSDPGGTLANPTQPFGD